MKNKNEKEVVMNDGNLFLPNQAIGEGISLVLKNQIEELTSKKKSKTNSNKKGK